MRIRTAIAQASGRCKVLIGEAAPAEAAAHFEAGMEEWAFFQTLLALNSDPNHPRVLNNVAGPPQMVISRAAFSLNKIRPALH